MRIFGIMLLLVAAASVSTAQTSHATTNDPPDLQILKKGWKSETRLVQDETRPESDALPSRPGRRRRLSVFDRATAMGRDDDDMWPTDKDRVQGYLYQVTVRNTGTKEIKAVKWQYTFTDRLDPRIVTRHRFYTKSKLASGKEKKLEEFTLSPPTGVINAKAVALDAEQPLIEQLQITRIEYTDGTVWEPPAPK